MQKESPLWPGTEWPVVWGLHYRTAKGLMYLLHFLNCVQDRLLWDLR